eukprot:SAG31_NODE_932_length_10913_cov_3.933235_3_plen_212_part_00
MQAGDHDEHGIGITKVGYHFIAGLLKHLPAITAVTAPTVNSYKRLIARGAMSGYTWAPIFQSWGGNNRSNTLRCNPGRVELRAADSACNPYLGMALCLAAGLEGIEQELVLPPPNKTNLFSATEGMSVAEMAANGIGRLPQNLAEAVVVSVLNCTPDHEPHILVARACGFARPLVLPRATIRCPVSCGGCRLAKKIRFLSQRLVLYLLRLG